MVRTAGIIILSGTDIPVAAESKSINDPKNILADAPNPSNPKLVIFNSSKKKINPVKMSRIPAAEIGRTEKEYKASIKHTAPNTPGKIAPGVENSKKKPRIPARNKR